LAFDAAHKAIDAAGAAAPDYPFCSAQKTIMSALFFRVSFFRRERSIPAIPQIQLLYNLRH
jgi:hypothetical protein